MYRKFLAVSTVTCVLLYATSAAALGAESYLFHTVQNGDTLQSVSRQYRTSWQTLAKVNGIRRPYLLSKGQTLRVPKPPFKMLSTKTTKPEQRSTAGDVIPSTFFPSEALTDKIKLLLPTEVPDLLHWRYIVVHHSATPNGNARGFDEFHRKRRHMEHGLAYHFVIDNGDGGPNGRVEVGKRWQRQWPGGHTANRLMNEIGIGICLVGNFEKDQPSRQQLESLVVLCKLLQDKCGIPDRNIILHRHVAQRGTLCPGRKFPWEKLRRMILGIKLPS